jgi:hypothetical protein
MSRNLVKVIELNSKDKIFECSLEEIEKAYEFAKEMEAIGLDVKIEAPGLPESLANELGVSKEDLQKLKESIDFEIDEHEDEMEQSCCFKES